MRFCVLVLALLAFICPLAHSAPVAAYDCTPIDLRLRGLHVIYAIDVREHMVHESMRDDSGAPYTPDPRRSTFREQTRPVEFDGTLALWSIPSGRGSIRRILDRTSNTLTISAPTLFHGHPHIVDVHVACQKLSPPHGFTE